MPSAPESLSLTTRSAEETERMAAVVAACVPAPAVIGLCGPLGAGKTCFVRGFAAGLGVDPSQVCSPSFVYLVNYEGGHDAMTHADLYRLGDLSPEAAGQAFADIGLTACIDGHGLTVVEWWEHYRGEAPGRLVSVEFTIETAEDRTVKLEFEGEDMAAVSRDIAERLSRLSIDAGE